MAPDREEITAGLLGGLVSGIVLGLIIQLTTSLLPAMAAVYGIDSPNLLAGWVAHLFHSLIFGVIYAGIVAGTVDQYITTVLMLTRRSDAVKGLIMPLTNRFGMAVVVTTAMGLIYGLLLWIFVPTLALPALTDVAQVPMVDGVLLLGYIVFGLLLGVIYGETVMG